MRSQATEIIERPDIPETVMVMVHRELTRMNHVLGNTAAVVRAVRRDPKPVRRVLDIGCGHGGVLLSLHRRLGVDVIGVDLRVPLRHDLPFPILQADAVCDLLPEADVALCVFMAHHLPETDLTAMILNVGRSCRRLILLDLVRSRIPLVLFRAFLAPFLSRISAEDGIVSIRRAYTKAELAAVARRALAGTPASIRHTVAPMNVRQIVDITY